MSSQISDLGGEGESPLSAGGSPAQETTGVGGSGPDLVGCSHNARPSIGLALAPSGANRCMRDIPCTA